MENYKMMTLEEQEAARQERLNEKGTEPPCPWCERPRVRRSDYIRCNPCATNWINGEDISKDPRAERRVAMLRTQGIEPTKTGMSGGARPVDVPTE